MLDDPSVGDITARLRYAVSADQLPASSRKKAAQLAERLAVGVRIALLGPKSVGKSTLCDVLLRQVPGNCVLGPTRIFSAGEQGTQDNLEAAGLTAFSHVSVSPKLLGRVQVIDIDMPSDDRAVEEVTTAVLSDVDIVLWCTQTFTAKEVSLWAEASDPLKDHSFLVLTKADELAEKGELKARVVALHDVVSEEFHSFFTTSARRVQGLLESGVPPTEAQFAASGVKALADALFHVTASGQRADMDGALLFLERCGIARDDLPEHVSAPKPSPTENPTPFHAARDRILARSLDLAEITFDDTGGDMEHVLECCGEIAEELVEIVSGVDLDSDEDRTWCNVFEEASDKITLMAMENDVRSAADAVTVLLQLRRDLETLTIP